MFKKKIKQNKQPRNVFLKKHYTYMSHLYKCLHIAQAKHTTCSRCRARAIWKTFLYFDRKYFSSQTVQSESLWNDYVRLFIDHWLWITCFDTSCRDKIGIRWEKSFCSYTISLCYFLIQKNSIPPDCSAILVLYLRSSRSFKFLIIVGNFFYSFIALKHKCIFKKPGSLSVSGLTGWRLRFGRVTCSWFKRII